MNRKNFWIHFTIAVILIITAAILGQIRRWESSIKIQKEAYNRSQKTFTLARTKKESEPEVLVRFRPDVTLSDIRKIAAERNDRVEDEIESVPNLVSIDDLDGFTPEEIAEEYRRMKDLVLYAEPNYEIKIENWQDEFSKDAVPNDPLFAQQWALKNTGQNGGKPNADINILKAWEKARWKEEIVVAVLDTGVDYTHPDLAANIWLRPDSIPQYEDEELGVVNDLRGFNAVDNLSDPMDDNGHGTHCAGIIGAEGNNGFGITGLNWKIKIMPLKFLGRNGSGSVKNAIEAINYVIDRKQKGVNIRVINASWGSMNKSKALEDAIRAAGEVGILFVAAAGNNSSNNDIQPHYPASYALQNIISVAALDRNDQLASFSNYGQKSVHIAAPGKEILSTWLNEDFREASGTSMAAPHVAGAAALIASLQPDISLEKLRQKILNSAEKLNSLKDKVASSGRLDVSKAAGV
ncbi:MAG: S8 family serine peptidase [Pyrinomonadaceae bacterium]|nr:S8 family serine peptidase [Pyrinomonadaceae bacterium]MCX7639610.1 S8 family serine peptidase [Pyrinomonadaceae bacterium]MDW8303372.1 S8 family serine peptidase [Acidobacteriota bacterium]